MVIAGVIGVVTWPIASGAAHIGLDVSWMVGLHLAARQGLQFGHDIAFTFGPLGFLGWPQPYVAWTSAAALLFVAMVHFTACLTFLHVIRQRLGLPIATTLVLVVAFTFPWIAGWRLYGVLISVAVVTAVYRRRERPTSLLFPIGLGIAVAVAALGKTNVAAVALAVGAVGVVSTARRPGRSFVAFVTTGMSAFLALWLMSGQRLDYLPAYVRSALDLTVGYGESMGAVDPGTDWASGVAALVTLILAGLLWRRTSTLPRRDRVVVLAVTGLTIFAEYRAGFTRAGVGVAIYLITLLALWPLTVPRTRSWAVAGLPVAAVLAAILAILTMPITTLIDPVGRAMALGSEANAALFHRREAAAATAASLRQQYGLPPEALAGLIGKTVHIEPWEAAAAYAYPEFEWSPEPVFQAYAAYTPGLDRLNADRLSGDEAPERILWITRPNEPLSIDRRGVWFDSPAAKIELLCRYVPLSAGPGWQVLEKVANRCGSAIQVGTLTTKAGDPTRVPVGMPPGIVTVRILGVASDPLTRLQILAYRAESWTVSDGQSEARIPLGTAAEPNVIGATADIGYCAPLALMAPPATLTIGPYAGAPGSDTPLTLEFAIIPVMDPGGPGIACP
jgi:hypothetical protein